MKKLLIAAPFAMLLVGCGPASVEDLIKNPEKLAEVVQECGLKKAQGGDTNTEECKNAEKATYKMMNNMLR